MCVLDTAFHVIGTSSDRVYRAFMSGWSKQGKRVRARSGTRSVYRNSSLRFRDWSPAVNTMSTVFSPALVSAAGMTMCSF